jgi:carboxypeptidase C (cathepsin A)
MLTQLMTIIWGLLQASGTQGQFPPPPADVTTVRSPVNGNITINFKSPTIGTCTTVFATQKQYTGYVQLPPFTLVPIQQNYAINTFFWFVEARVSPETAPLTIYINGGPGSSSMVGLFQETGPCEVIEVAEGELGTQARDWGWDRSSNMIYIDQPSQVGFSFDTLSNGSLNLLNNDINVPPAVLPPEQPAYTFLDGTFSSQDYHDTTNTTQIAAYAIWHMLQGFLASFPQYNPSARSNNTQTGPVGINLFAESYGGKYGPIFAATWEEQNTRRQNGSIPKNGTLDIQLASLGIMQGCVDDLVQGRFYPIFANNNTYGIQAYSLADEINAADDYLSAGGCQQLIQACRNAASTMDPLDNGNIAAVNQKCQEAEEYCNNYVIGPYQTSGRDVYDISQLMPDPFPPSTYLEYLNSEAVQSSIGALVNYTELSSPVSTAFLSTGDYDRGNEISDMAYLLSLGVRVALVYGDRDYICNWLGGEAVSFSIAAQSEATSPFYSAGYAEIVVNSTYVGGVVRQYGNLSFSRIYDAGHLVPAYQPETAFTVFTRIIMGTDISTGEPVDLSTFATTGPANATHMNTPPEQFEPKCWIRNIASTCNEEDITMIESGEGVIINGVLYNASSDWQAPASSIMMQAGMPGTVPPAMTATTSTSMGMPMQPLTSQHYPTGVYVATNTPTPSASGAADRTWNADMNLYIGTFLALLVVNFSIGSVLLGGRQ